MRLVLVASFVSLALSLAACDHGHGEHYDTLQECVTDHATEGLSESNSITTCLLDHLDGIDFATQAECEAYVTANGGYPNSVTMACTDYFAQM